MLEFMVQVFIGFALMYWIPDFCAPYVKRAANWLGETLHEWFRAKPPITITDHKWDDPC